MKIDTTSLILIAMISYLFLMWFSLTVWVWNDVRERTEDKVFQGIAVILVLIGNIFGVAVYLVIRPRETFREAYFSELEERIIHAQARALKVIDEKKIVTLGSSPKKKKARLPNSRKSSQPPVSK